MSIPSDIWNQHVAILAKPGRGKTVTAKGGAAALMKDGMRVGVVDPSAAWWGMRLKADGITPSKFPMVIFGGKHADIEITPQMGAKIGTLLGTADYSWIIDTSLLGNDARTEFMTSWAEAIFASNRRRLNLFIDECHLFIPQQRAPGRKSKAMLDAVTNLIAGGRGLGFCVTMISQRPAKVHKDSLTTTEAIICLGMLSPQDVGAVKDWVTIQGDSTEAKEMISSLPALPVGEGWVYAPAIGMLKRMKFPMIGTYDSSRAPGAGENLKTPTELGQINLDDIRASLAPPARKQVSTKPVAAIAPKGPPAAPSAHVLAAEYRKGFEHGVRYGKALVCNSITAETREMAARYGKDAEPVSDLPSPTNRPKPVINGQGIIKPPVAEVIAQAKRRDTFGEIANGKDGLDRPLQKIVDAIRYWNEFGLTEPTHSQVAFIAGYVPGSGTWSRYLSVLRSMELIEPRGVLKLTEAGVNAANEPEAQPDAEALRESVIGKLDAPLVKILRPLLECYPEPMSHDDLAAVANYVPGSGTWSRYLSGLRSLDLIEKRGELKAQDWLFP